MVIGMTKKVCLKRKFLLSSVYVVGPCGKFAILFRRFRFGELRLRLAGYFYVSERHSHNPLAFSLN